MIFGSLSGTDKTEFQKAQNRRGYHQQRDTAAPEWVNAYARVSPSHSVWIQDFGDIDQYVQSIETDRPLENENGQGNIAIGKAWLTLDNSDSQFYDSGGSNFPENASIRIWLGYDRYRVPVFAGRIRSAYPGERGDRVYLSCSDEMILFYDAEVEGSRGVNNTPELVVEDFCSELRIQSGIRDSLELDTTYDDTNFNTKSMLSALNEVCNSVFNVAIADEEGVVRMYEREHVILSEDRWAYDEKNVTEVEPLAKSEVYNEVWLEYDENLYVRALDQRSIDDNGKQQRTPRILLCNSEDISSKVHGRQERAFANDEEGFQITTAAGTSTIDAIQLALRQDGSASGNITVTVYTETTSLPVTLLGTSQNFASAYLDTEFYWQTFYFVGPVSISPSTNYWVVIDTSSVSAGTVYIVCSRADATGKYAENTGSWVAVNNLQPLHRIRSSKMAQRVADDIIRFYKDKKDRLAIRSLVGVPQVQLLDNVYVDIEVENTTLSGQYTVERVQHEYTPRRFTTRHTMRKRSIEGPGAGARDASQNFKFSSGKTFGDAEAFGSLFLFF